MFHYRKGNEGKLILMQPFFGEYYVKILYEIAEK